MMERMDLHSKASGHHGDMGHHQESQAGAGGMDMKGMGSHMDMAGMGDMAKMEMPMMMMSHYFTLKSDTPFLLQSISIATPEGILCALAFTILLAVVFELMSIKGQKFYSKIAQHRKEQPRRGYACNLLLLTLWKMSSVCVGYVMMLCVMTYNAWLLVAVVLGSGLGYWVLRPILVSHGGHDGDIKTRIETEPLHDFTPDQIDTDTDRNGDSGNGNVVSKLLHENMA